MSGAEGEVALVDPQDRAVGVAGRPAAHREGRLHRAFPMVRGHDGRLPLRKRHAGKCRSGMIEHAVVHLFAGPHAGHVRPDPCELWPLLMPEPA
jgi:isopentenyldiphosphate isomerase